MTRRDATIDVAAWLRGLGLGEYEATFRENAIDETVLARLTHEYLKELGVAALGHRLKLLDAIAELHADRSAKAPSAATTTSGAPSVPAPDRAERRQVTVMFSDLVGSTALSARLDPEDLREVISAYQKCVAETVQRFGGFVAKYMGDGLLVYFGYPHAHEDDAERAVRAGLELIAAVGALRTNSPLQTRVGIATGLVVVGDLVGSGSAQEQAIVGETPNLAARLQGIAEPNTIVAAESTRNLVGNLFEFDDLGAQHLKGIDEPVRAHAALRTSTVESRFEAMRTATTPLVGRSEEIDLLLRRWDQAKAGEGCVVLVSGEPGIGKSRIAQTVVEQLSGRPHALVRYFCSPHHRDSVLYPIINQLERAAGFRREDTDQERLDKLKVVLARGNNDLIEVLPLIADLLAIPVGHHHPVQHFRPQKRREKTLCALLSQLEGLAARQPVLVVFEDLHWADPTTHEYLDLLIDREPALRALVVITFRPEIAPPWVGRPHVTTLNLNRLRPRQRAEMIAHLTGAKTMPKEVTEQIIDRTDGVPLFIEELTKSVVESGLVTENGSDYATSGPVQGLAIPTSLHASLLARLDRLAPAREAAQIGAALGRSFSHELISAVADMPQQQLDDSLAQLVSAELMFRRGSPPSVEYTFKHALVQDAAYSTLLRSHRVKLHGRIAATLQGQFPEVARERPEIIAQHCTEAGLMEQAVRYRLAAGQRAFARCAMKEAVAQLRKGLDLVATMPEAPWCIREEIRLQNALGVALAAAEGPVAQVAVAHQRARELSRKEQEPEELYRAIFGLWLINHRRGDLEKAAQLSNELLSTTEGEQDVGRVLQAHHTAWTTAWQRGDLEASRRHADVGVRLYDTDKHHQLTESYAGHDAGVCCRSANAFASWLMGYPDKAAAWAEDSLQLARDLGHPNSLGNALEHAAYVYEFRGEPQLAEKQTRALIEVTTERGIPIFAAYAQVHQAWLLLARGEADAAVSELGKGIAAADALGSKWKRSYCLGLLAEAHLRAGRYEEGLINIGKAFDFVHLSGERWWEAELHRLKAELLQSGSLTDWSSAEACCYHALDLARHQRARSLELRAATTLARLWRDQGKWDEARDLLAPVYGWFTEGFDTHDLKEARALLDELAA